MEGIAFPHDKDTTACRRPKGRRAMRCDRDGITEDKSGLDGRRRTW
ncbi:hypothetical protein EVA_00005 [gut metagenome]|uniref:Uncharacterized protein n=1 Tax=gut metagenome TaxID=749906 RepID=J9DE05_9ZZZZ